MKDRNANNEITKKLRSLGAGYHLDLPQLPADPEKTILELLSTYWNANDMFFMLFTLLKYEIGGLIHVDRLVKLAHDSLLPNDQIVLLIALANNMVEFGHTRFSLVEKKLKKKGMKMISPPERETDEYLIKRWGLEKTLVPFGVKARAFYDHQPKKLYALKRILQENQWLKARALAGVNYRADIIYLKSSGLAESGYQAAQISGCTKAAAYSVWKTLEPIQDLDELMSLWKLWWVTRPLRT